MFKRALGLSIGRKLHYITVPVGETGKQLVLSFNDAHFFLKAGTITTEVIKHSIVSERFEELGLFGVPKDSAVKHILVSDESVTMTLTNGTCEYFVGIYCDGALEVTCLPQ